MAQTGTQNKLNETSCRICLETQYPIVKINSKLLNMIVYCFGIEITNGPLNLCSQCVVYIVKINDFKQKVIQSNDLWNSYAQEICKRTFKHQPIDETKIKFEPESDVDYCETLLSDRELDFKTGENGDSKNQDIKLFTSNICKEDNEDLSLTCGTSKISTVLTNHSKKKILKIKNGRKSKLKCEKCKKVYKRTEYLVRHQEHCNVLEAKDNVKTEVSFNCGLCSMTSDSKNKISEHIAEHFSNNDLECKICGFRGTDFAEMEGHRYKHHIKSRKLPKSCHICNKKCIATMSLIFHFRSVHMKMKGSTCKHCNKFIRTYRGWKRHELLHTTYNFICDICGKKFLQRNNIVTHMKKHYGVKEHICDICGKAFTRSTYLRLHISTVHTSQSPVKCSHCDKVYKSQFHLDQHIKEINLEKPFQCEHCLRFYATEKRLKKHLFWHSGERPFSCDICSATYKAKSTLKLHMRESHSSYRPFKCTICEKAFLTQQRLRRHNSMHTGLRKFKCLYCERSFHSNPQLNAHCSSQHKTVMGQQQL